jgi:hypothetical protein
VEREKSQKKPTLGKMGYQLETTALISKENYNTFRITRIMLILGKLKVDYLEIKVYRAIFPIVLVATTKPYYSTTISPKLCLGFR